VPPPHAADTLVPLGVEIVDLASAECMALLREFTEAHPDIWAEDGGRT
jgi:hypothetical protein